MPVNTGVPRDMSVTYFMTYQVENGCFSRIFLLLQKNKKMRKTQYLSYFPSFRIFLKVEIVGFEPRRKYANSLISSVFWHYVSHSVT